MSQLTLQRKELADRNEIRASSHFSLRDMVPTAPFGHGAPLARPLEKIPHPPP